MIYLSLWLTIELVMFHCMYLIIFHKVVNEYICRENNYCQIHRKIQFFPIQKKYKVM